MLRLAISSLAALTVVLAGCGPARDATARSSSSRVDVETHLDWSYELTDLGVTIDGEGDGLAAPLGAGSHTVTVVASLRHRCGLATSVHGKLRVASTRTFVASATTRIAVEVFTRAPTQAPDERVGIVVHLHDASGAPSLVTVDREHDCEITHDEWPLIAPAEFVPPWVLMPSPVLIPIPSNPVGP